MLSREHAQEQTRKLGMNKPKKVDDVNTQPPLPPVVSQALQTGATSPPLVVSKHLKLVQQVLFLPSPKHLKLVQQVLLPVLAGVQSFVRNAWETQWEWTRQLVRLSATTFVPTQTRQTAWNHAVITSKDFLVLFATTPAPNLNYRMIPLVKSRHFQQFLIPVLALA